VNFNPDEPAERESGIDAKGEVALPVKAPVPVTPRDTSEFAQTAARMMSQPRDELACLLSLLEPKVWMAGNWVDVASDGWKDVRHGVVLKFDGARELITARIKELGLNPVLVYAHPKSHSTLEESVAFGQLNFAEKMNCFADKENENDASDKK
jgi:hypothetical protein